MENFLDGIQFESLTTLAEESFFKGMPSDYNMPTVLQFAYRRAQSVKDNMLRIYEKIFSYFTGPNSNTAHRKSSIARLIGSRKTKQMAANEGNREQSRGEAEILKEFARKYGRGVRQENVRSKMKTLPEEFCKEDGEIYMA